jgi:hypothetical protein
MNPLREGDVSSSEQYSSSALSSRPNRKPPSRILSAHEKGGGFGSSLGYRGWRGGRYRFSHILAKGEEGGGFGSSLGESGGGGGGRRNRVGAFAGGGSCLPQKTPDLPLPPTRNQVSAFDGGRSCLI